MSTTRILDDAMLDDVESMLETFDTLHRGAIAQTRVVEDSVARLDSKLAVATDDEARAVLTRRGEIMRGMLRVCIAEQSARGQLAGLLRSHATMIGRRIISLYPDDEATHD